MDAERHVRFFRNGRNQAIRIPKEFEMDAEEALIRREDDRLVIEPITKKGLLATLATLPPIEEPFPNVDDGVPEVDDVAI